MFNIIGFYSYEKLDHKIVRKIRIVFEKKASYVRYIVFQQNHLFLDFQTLLNNEAKDFYYINKKKEAACFIRGNIFAFEDTKKEFLFEKNKAEFILAQEKKYGFSFIKNLRGEFNVILIEGSIVYLLNDRLGLSPMYIYPKREGVYFCNHPEPLIWLHKDNRTDYASIAEFLIYGFVPQGKSFIQNLTNQSPGTIVKLDKKNIKIKKYLIFQPAQTKKFTRPQKLRLLKKTFHEAVMLRAQQKECHASVSGGWDTRFNLAHLLELKKKPLIFTLKDRKEDVVIAQKITKALGLEHILHTSAHLFSPLESVKRSLRFKLEKEVPDIYETKRPAADIISFITTPRFEGIFGTELFGHAPEDFVKKITSKFNNIASRIFKTNFLASVSNGKSRKLLTDIKSLHLSDNVPYTFLTQVGRTYLNIFYTSGWQRPTRFFSYLFLNPFVDSAFVSLLCSLKYPDDFYYKTYQEIYERYFPKFLKFPWTFSRYRLKNNLLKKDFKRKVPWTRQRQYYLDLMKEDKKFRNFLLRNKITKKNKESILPYLKELYFVHRWFETYQGVLKEDKFQLPL